MCNKVASTYTYIVTRHILMVVLWPSGQSGSDLLNSRRKYAILGRGTQNKFADCGLKAAIIKGQYTTGIIQKKNILKYFARIRYVIAS